MNKMKTSKENSKHDGNFKKKNINHNPQDESARVAFKQVGEKHES